MGGGITELIAGVVDDRRSLRCIIFVHREPDPDDDSADEVMMEPDGIEGVRERRRFRRPIYWQEAGGAPP